MKAYFKTLFILLTLLLGSSSLLASETISFSGRLVQATGAPVVGPVDLTFKILVDEGGGKLEKCSLTQTNIPLSNGIFNVTLDFGTTCLSNTKKLSEIIEAAYYFSYVPYIRTIDTTHSKTYPDQPIRAVPLAVHALTGGSGNYNLDLEYQTCTNGQILKMNGSGNFVCSADDNGAGGTVTSVGTGNGLTGGPITGSGTINVDFGTSDGQVPAISSGKIATTLIPNLDGSIITTGTIDEARLPTATSSANGKLTSSDWTIFNNKQDDLGTGTTNQYLKTDGSSNLVWSTISTSEVTEGTNLYYTTLRARNDAVADAITDGVTNVAPSQNAVFDALATKADASGNANISADSITVDTQGGVNLSPYGAAAGNTSEIRFYELGANGTNYTGFKAPDSLASDVIYTLPTSGGVNNYVLSVTNAATGTLSWVDVSTSTGVSNTGDLILNADSDSDSNGEVVLQTKGVDRVVVDNDGKVGVGIATPSVKFHVVGEANSGPMLLERTQSDDNTNRWGLKIQRTNSSGVGAAGIGTRILFALESDVEGNVPVIAQVAATMTDPTDGAENSELTFSTATAGAVTQKMAITSSGNVGIGTASPNTTSLLDLSSTTRGFLGPRMTTTQRDAIASPANGLQIYNTTTNAVNFYNGSSWQELGIAGSGVINVATGTGLTGGPITSTGTISIANSGVDNAQLANQAVTTAKLGNQAVTDTKLASDAVTTVKILDANVTTAKIADDAITSAKLAAGAVDSTALGANSVATGNIVDGTIVNADVSATAAIAYSKLAIADADLSIAKTSGLQTALDAKLPLAGGTMTGDIDVNGNDLLSIATLGLDGSVSGAITVAAPATVTTYTLTLPDTAGTNGYVLQTDGSGNTSWAATTNGDITAVNTNTGSGLSGGTTSGDATLQVVVDNSTVEIATNTIQVKDAGITTAKLATDAVTTVKITDANVTAAKLATDSVTTTKIVDANVTTAKLADDAVTSAKLAAGAVDSTALGANSVATGNIVDGTIVNADISATAAIDYSKLNVADADLTIAKTSGLQTALDAKLPLAGGTMTGNIAMNGSSDITMTGSTSGVLTLDAASAVTDYTFTFPAAAGTSGQVLVTDGSGTTSWTTVNTSSADGHSLDAADGSPTDVVYVDNDGKVGIGTTTPYNNLSIYQADGSYNNISLTNADTGNASATSGFRIGLGSDEVGRLVNNTTGKGIEFWTEETARMAIDNNGNVGIGTTTPASQLELVDTSTSTTTIDQVKNTLTLNPTANHTGIANAVDTELYTQSAGTFDFASVVTSAFKLFHDGTGTVNDARGVNGVVHNQSTGTITTARGLMSSVDNDSTGTITAAKGIESGITNNSTGTITTAKMIEVPDLVNAGTITDTYGVYVGDITTGTQTNTPFSFYASDANAYNYFAGNVGIGTTSPTQKLDILSSGDGATFVSRNGDTASGAQGLHIYHDTGSGPGARNSLLYHNGAFELYDQTNAASRFWISTAGNIGIGLTAPTSKLHVDGGVTVTTGNDICIAGGNCLSAAGTGSGDITSVNTNAGSGLSGGATSGDATLQIVVDNSTVEIATNTIQVKDSGIVTAKIADANVTTAKLADDAVTAAKIAAGAVDTTALGADAVTSAKIADGEIVNADISGTAAIAYSKLAIADADLTIAKTSGLQTALDAKLPLAGGTMTGDIAMNGSSDITMTGSTSGVLTLDAAATVTPYTFTFPANAGTSGYVLQTDGSGTTSWVNGSTFSTTAAGSSGSIQFNDGSNGFTADASNLHWDDSNNRLGIGTNTPSYLLDVNSTNTDTSGSLTQVASTIVLNPGSASTLIPVALQGDISTDAANAQNHNIVIPTASKFFHNGTGTVADARGLNVTSRNKSTGTITSSVAVNAASANDSTGSVTNATTFFGDVSNGSTGTITTAKGLDVKVSNTGTITNTYGVYVGDVSSGTQTNTPYSIYASDANSYNYFAGNVGIGTTSPTMGIATREVTISSGTTGDVDTALNLQGYQASNDSLATINGYNGSNRVAMMNFRAGTSDDDGQVTLWTAKDGTLTRAMTIDEDQNVGIGTNTPLAELHIAQTGNAKIILGTKGDGASEQATINFVTLEGDTKSLGDATSLGWQLFARGDNFNGTEDNSFGAVYWNGTSWTHAFRATASGNFTAGGADIPNEKLTVSGVTSLKETTAPTATSGFGKIYVKSSDSKLYFMDDSGTETDLLAGGGGSGDITGVITNSGSGLSGGAASGDATLQVVVDDSTVEIATNTIQVKDGGITSAKIGDGEIVNADISATAAIAYSKLAIADGDLTVAKTTGLQTALDAKLPLAGGTMTGAIAMGDNAITGLPSLGLDGATLGTITLQPPLSVTDYTLTLPSTAGTSGQALVTNGSGTTSWSSVSTASGASGSIQFSDGSGGLSSDATNFFWDNANNRIGLGTNSPSKAITIAQTADEHGIKILGYDDRSTRTTDIMMDSSGYLVIDTTTKGYLKSGGANTLTFDNNQKVGIGVTLPNERLTVNGVTSLAETTAPTATSGYGKLYVKSSDSKLYFMDDSGSETDLTSGGGGSSTGASGSLQFSDGSSGFSADATNLFWDDTNNRLGIGTNSTYSPLTVVGNANDWRGVIQAVDNRARGTASPSITFHDASSGYDGTDAAGWLGFYSGYGSGVNMAFANNINGGDLSFATNSGAGFATRMTIADTGEVGIGTTSPSTKLEVNGTVTASDYLYSSDENYKKDIRQLQNSLAKLMEINGVRYLWRQDEFPEKNFRDGDHIGLIAQNVETVFPELVQTKSDGYKSVRYANLVAVIIEAIKEQQAMINQNQEQNTRAIASLKEEVKVEKEKNESLKSELEMMKAYLCSKDAKAPFCQK